MALHTHHFHFRFGWTDTWEDASIPSAYQVKASLESVMLSHSVIPEPHLLESTNEGTTEEWRTKSGYCS